MVWAVAIARYDLHLILLAAKQLRNAMTGFTFEVYISMARSLDRSPGFGIDASMICATSVTHSADPVLRCVV